MEANSFYSRMHDENIMLTFKGEATYELVNALLASIEPKIMVWESDARVRKRLYSVLVECLQNMVHHGDSMDGIPTLANSGKVTLLLLISEPDAYCLHTGNCIHNQKIKKLKGWIDSVNVLSPEDLKTSYREILERVRCARATRLLLETQLPILEIALSLGYTEHPNFTRAFLTWTGHTPNSFRLARGHSGGFDGN